MRTAARVVVIGGGVVGCSVLYHLTKAGWTDVVLLERRELTAGSTWHSAGGMHTLNGDPNVSKLQQYTIKLYQEIERISGQDCGIHLPGGLMLADSAIRMDYLRMAQARGRYLGMDLELITPSEARALFPLLDEQYFVGALFDPVEGHVDPSGVTNAYATCARLAGAEIVRNAWVDRLSQRTDGTWDVHVDADGGTSIHAEHVVNAAGLWAREVGRMVGLELPVLAMEHMYLVTQDMPEVVAHMAATNREMPMALDFGGEVYIRQEGAAMLLGTYEQACVPWSPQETPWDFGARLLKPDIDRIAPELEVAFRHYPAMATTGIRKVVNGPFTFSPDGNPLVGPIRGLSNYWVACGVMAGLSQGGGVGLALANWLTEGDSGLDIWGMDVARYGDYANLAYTNAKVRENYARRFRITYPNEELPAARPLLTTPIHGRLEALNAVWGASFGLEHALWFQAPGQAPVEEVTFRRSNAWAQVAAECAAVRHGVGLIEISNFAKYRVTGPGAAAWLSSLLTNRLPAAGRIGLTAMLNPAGRIVAEFTVAHAAGSGATDEFFLFGSHVAEVHHSRWFLAHLPADGSVSFDVLGLGLVGLAVAGPRARDVVQQLTEVDLGRDAFRFMDFRTIDLGLVPAHVGRISYTGELGYELWIAPEYQQVLFDRLMVAGAPHGLRPFGQRALLSLRLEKGYGTWFREYRPIYTPHEAGINGYVRLDHEFIGRAAVEAEAARGPDRRLVTLVVEPDPEDPADVIGDEPIWYDGSVVGWVTSGGYGHFVELSLALGYVPTHLATPEHADGFEVEILGRRRPAHLRFAPVHDPEGRRMRA